MLENLNMYLFSVLNATHSTSWAVIYLAIFCANYLIYLPIIASIYLWLRHPQWRELLAKILFTCIISLCIVFLIRLISYYPRPFTVQMGTNYLDHTPTSSFPSQHGVVIWAMCMTVYFHHIRAAKWLVLVLTVIALLVSWSRIYLGVHWPLDILAAGLISLVTAYCVNKIWFFIHEPIMTVLLTIYRFCFRWFISKELIKY